MMKYNTIKWNDVANAPGISVSIYLQGCERHCKNCFNPETWDFNLGQELTSQTIETIITKIKENNIPRNLCILGGEPLHIHNCETTQYIISEIRKVIPKLPIYIWTGYTYEELIKQDNDIIFDILNNINVLIDGPYIDELRNITLKMRGSSNQRIITLDKGKVIKIEN